ncbi:pyruvate formate-lyase-activating protein [Anaerosporobacter sp.]|uniref:pyruvate formate-lyase-activating protein n=1 Tax=Anaerosporobacter sp. TaxID=1872529 RepID=UPI00286F2F5E|nr:pyruvate formate-lyase-activating protein [Anaerosporobacter sp.]
MTIGKIHSIETCGTVDGPGIRFVAFLQGCPLRCQYCHNPDTWDTKKGKEYTPEELVSEIVKYKSYMKFSGGGTTFTGGEPLLQADFVKEAFQLCKKNDISTALDTSGFIFNDTVKEVLEYTDVVLLDIKNYDSEVFKTITGVALDNTLAFLDYIREKNIKTWIRYVLVPGLSDNIEAITKLAEHLKDYPNVSRIELLPFHKMGEYKWEELGYTYSLKETSEPSLALVNEVKSILETSGIAVYANV